MVLVLSFLCLIVGLVTGWMAAERYVAFMAHERHDFEDLFDQNPHPEIYDDEGNLYRGDYTTITFDPGFDPDKFNPETDILTDEDM